MPLGNSSLVFVGYLLILATSANAVARPAPQATRPKTTLDAMEASAFTTDPLPSIWNVSSEKVEKVVNPPRKPVTSRSQRERGIDKRSRKPAARPMKKQPRTLTIKVPQAKPFPKYLVDSAETAKRHKVPSPPPSTTSMAFMTRTLRLYDSRS